MKLTISTIALVTVIAVRVDAQVPGHFVSETDCMAASPTCMCSDAPMMEVYRDQQKKGRNAWVTVGSSFPATPAAALTAFGTAFTGEPRIDAQFMSCPGYNAAINDPTKIAGVRPSGDTAYDPCFCAAFCKDIIQSTIDHERAHRPTLVLGFLSGLPQQTACKAVSATQPMCDRLDANTLINSELISYQIGIHTLDSAIDRLAEQEPPMQCTWAPLPPVTLLSPPATPVPSSFWQRLVLLAERFWNGVNA